MPPSIPTIRQPDWKRVLETGAQFTELRRSQARDVVADLVAQGQLARDQMSAAVDEVIEISRRRSDNLRKIVQSEVQRQLGAIGLATKSDLRALERRLTRSARETNRTGPGKQAPKKSAKRSPAKKAPAKKARATRTPVKKTTAKRAPAKKAAKSSRKAG
jgi:polyhydroxyalkanoate synthesis regulator phasin